MWEYHNAWRFSKLDQFQRLNNNMHIVYKLTFLKRRESNQYPFYYIGTKSNCQVINNLILDKKNKPYFGSSKYKNYKDIVNQNINDILVEILYSGSSYADCLLKERDIQIKNDVVMSPKYFNNMIAIGNNFHDPDYIMMRNLLSNKCCRIHKDHDDIKNGLWVGITTGTSWYNNGDISKTYQENKQPEGWVRGRLWKLPAHNKGKKQDIKFVKKGVATRLANNTYVAWNKGLKNVQIFSEETRKKMSDIRKGRKSPTEGKKWITDGILNRVILINELVPDGWRYGQTKIKK